MHQNKYFSNFPHWISWNKHSKLKISGRATESLTKSDKLKLMREWDSTAHSPHHHHRPQSTALHPPHSAPQAQTKPTHWLASQAARSQRHWLVMWTVQEQQRTHDVAFVPSKPAPSSTSTGQWAIQTERCPSTVQPLSPFSCHPSTAIIARSPCYCCGRLLRPAAASLFFFCSHSWGVYRGCQNAVFILALINFFFYKFYSQPRRMVGN